jgi:hypothetical protein
VNSSRDPRKRRLVIGVGLFILLIIAGLIIGGWYKYYFSPPRETLAHVHDVKFNQADVVQRARMIQAGQDFGGAHVGLMEIMRVLWNDDVNVSSGPFTLGMVQMEMLKQAAPEFGVNVTEEEIDLFIESTFTPSVPEGQEVSEDQIERERKELYQVYLNRNRLTDKQFRTLMKERFYFFDMREALSAGLSKETEHVEIWWVRVPLVPGPNIPDPDKFQNIPEIRERLEEEGFEAVAPNFAYDVTGKPLYEFADTTGYVGWLPKGAFPSLDKYIFGTAEISPLPLDQISPPIDSSQYYYILKVSDGPEIRPIEDRWQDRRKDVALQEWIKERFEIGTSEGWIGVSYNSKLYAWAQKQINDTSKQRRGNQEAR